MRYVGGKSDDPEVLSCVLCPVPAASSQFREMAVIWLSYVRAWVAVCIAKVQSSSSKQAGQSRTPGLPKSRSHKLPQTAPAPSAPSSRLVTTHALLPSSPSSHLVLISACIHMRSICDVMGYVSPRIP